MATPLEAADVTADEIVTAFCRYFEDRDLESAFRPINTLTSGRISSSSKNRVSRGKTIKIYDMELKAAGGWSASYNYQQKENGDQYGFDLSVRAREPQNGLIFNSLGEAKKWLRQYGEIRYDSDLEQYSVHLKMFRARGGSFPVTSLHVEFSEDAQSIGIEWGSDEDESAVRDAICQ